MESEANRLLEKADRLCSEAEDKHKWALLVEANALRSKAKQKRKAVDDAKKETEAIQHVQKKLKLQ